MQRCNRPTINNRVKVSKCRNHCWIISQLKIQYDGFRKKKKKETTINSNREGSINNDTENTYNVIGSYL